MDIRRKEQENLYDGEGLRAGLRENGKGSSFLFYNGEILTECDGDGVPVRRHLLGMGLSHMQTLDDGMYHACYQDEQGSTAFITGDGGEVENSYVYDAFGNVLERKEGIRNDILYRGQKYDQEAGQYYLRARYYNPVIGRFIQEDTYRGDGLNLYAYCGNNPVMYYDPSGHTKVTQPITEPEVPRTAGEGQNSSFGIVNGKTPASRLADKVRELSNSKRPNTVAVIRTADGQYYVGYNRAEIYNESVQSVLDNLGNSNQFNRQCAEINALSRALNNGADLNNATISIANVRGINNKSGVHGTYKEPCNVCQPLLDFLGIEDIH